MTERIKGLRVEVAKIQFCIIVNVLSRESSCHYYSSESSVLSNNTTNYLALLTRPNLFHSLSRVAQTSSNPTE